MDENRFFFLKILVTVPLPRQIIEELRLISPKRFSTYQSRATSLNAIIEHTSSSSEEAKGPSSINSEEKGIT